MGLFFGYLTNLLPGHRILQHTQMRQPPTRTQGIQIRKFRQRILRKYQDREIRD